MSRKRRKNVPELRFAEFEKQKYKTYQLSDISFVERGKFTARPRNSPQYYGGHIPFVQTGDIARSNGKIDSYSQTLNDEGLKVSKLFPEGSILMTIAANIGDVAITEIDVACPDSIVVVQVKSEFSRDWVFYCLYLAKEKLESFATQNAQKNINLQVIRPLEISAPSEKEQEKIASFLGAVDARLTQLRRKHELLQTYKRGVMQKIFSQQIRFKQDDGTPFPNWEKKELGTYLKEYIEKVSASTSLPIYSSSREGLKPQKEYFADRELKNEGQYGVVPVGFFVYRHMSDDLTFKFNINTTEREIAVSKEYPVFTTKNLNSSFLLYKLNFSDDFKRFAIAQKRGGTRTRLYYKNLAEWKTLLPEIKEQEKIVTFLTAIERKAMAVEQWIEGVEQFKKGLLQKMFV